MGLQLLQGACNLAILNPRGPLAKLLEDGLMLQTEPIARTLLHDSAQCLGQGSNQIQDLRFSLGELLPLLVKAFLQILDAFALLAGRQPFLVRLQPGKRSRDLSKLLVFLFYLSFEILDSRQLLIKSGHKLSGVPDLLQLLAPLADLFVQFHQETADLGQVGVYALDIFLEKGSGVALGPGKGRHCSLQSFHQCPVVLGSGFDVFSLWRHKLLGKRFHLLDHLSPSSQARSQELGRRGCIRLGRSQLFYIPVKVRRHFFHAIVDLLDSHLKLGSLRSLLKP
ncbi:Uncharacterised protein [uncultured archaeon]|nr:Uncharacterised protein [uncultured archaeon]